MAKLDLKASLKTSHRLASLMAKLEGIIAKLDR